MSTQQEHMNVKLNTYCNTEVGSYNFPKPKPSTGIQIDNDQQSPETLRKRKVGRGTITCHYFISICKCMYYY